jgi:hypothetical protein
MKSVSEHVPSFVYILTSYHFRLSEVRSFLHFVIKLPNHYACIDTHYVLMLPIPIRANRLSADRANSATGHTIYIGTLIQVILYLSSERKAFTTVACN